MKAHQNKIKLYFICTAILTIIVTALRTVSILTVYENDIEYYKKGAILPLILTCMIILSVAFLITPLITLRKAKLPTSCSHTDHHSTFSSLLCGTVHISSAAILLIYQRGTVNTVTLIALMGFILATVYFFYEALCPESKKSTLSVIPAIGAIISLVAVIVRIHVDYTIPLNNPNKTLVFIAFAAIALFLVQSLRYTVERPLPTVYFSTACIAFLLSSTLSISGIIGHYAGTLSGGSFLIYYIIAFAYAVFTLSRLISFIKLSALNAIDGDTDESESTIEKGNTDI